MHYLPHRVSTKSFAEIIDILLKNEYSEGFAMKPIESDTEDFPPSTDEN